MRELLAPAGNFEKLKFSLLYGADAVYIGGQDFSLRANAANFTHDEIKEAIEYAHKFEKKVYVTVNIIFHDEDFTSLDEYLKFLSDINVDGVIVSDMAVIELIKSLNLDLFIILSTQASCFNKYSANFYKNIGVSRIVTARECSKEEIKEIIDYSGIEVEAFIHGAMCTNFSGKCVLSNKTTLRDANRGGCAQVCRWCFETEEKEDFTMMSKDLNMVDNIKKMFDLGIVSYKIEGRMRSIYYLATVVGIYKQIFDLVKINELTDEKIKYFKKLLNRVANRESKPQFFENLPTNNDQYFQGRDECTNKDFLGVVLNYDEKTNLVTLEQRNYFKKGDVVEFFNPKFEIFKTVIDTIYDKDNNEIEIANHPKMIVKFKVLKKLSKDDIMRVEI